MKFKNLLASILSGALVLSLVGCGSKGETSLEDDKKIIIGATAVPHAEILEEIKPIIDIIDNVIPDIIEGMASLIITLKIIWKSDAPKDFAASISPLSTSFNAPSITLAINGADPIVKGTKAAVSPILFPTIILVKGIIATTKIINGKLLNVLTINPKIELITLFGFNPSFSVITNTIANINPISVANIVDIPTIYNVCPNASINISVKNVKNLSI